MRTGIAMARHVGASSALVYWDKLFLRDRAKSAGSQKSLPKQPHYIEHVFLKPPLFSQPAQIHLEATLVNCVQRDLMKMFSLCFHPQLPSQPCLSPPLRAAMVPPFCPRGASRGMVSFKLQSTFALFESRSWAWHDGLPYCELRCVCHRVGGQATGVPAAARAAAHAPTGAPRRGPMVLCP